MTFNPMLDEFPDNYHGYLINSDFRTGIKIMLCLSDKDLNDEQRKGVALQLLYGRGIPTDLEEALDGLEWFMQCGDTHNINSISNSDKSNLSRGADTNIIDFDFDSTRIYTAFLRVYDIDLTKDKLHFFKFMYMLSDLEKVPSHCKVLEYRATNIQTLPKESKAAYQALKKMYTLDSNEDNVPLTADELEQLESVGIDEKLAKELGL